MKTNNFNSFNVKIKNEIINQPFEANNFQICLIFFMHHNSIIKYDKLTNKSQLVLFAYQSKILDFFAINLKKFFQIDTILIKPTKTYGLFNLIIDNQEKIDYLNQISYLIDDNIYWKKQKSLLKYALIGTYLACGVICHNYKNHFHCEMLIKNLVVWNLITKFLVFKKIEFKIYQYQNKKIYIKKINMISDFLKLLNASECMMEIENIAISKDYINQTTRLSNLDAANLNKITKSSLSQTKMIDALKKSKYWNQLPLKIKNYCQLKLQNPYASFQELAILYSKKYQLKISKSGINHCARYLKKIYQLLTDI